MNHSDRHPSADEIAAATDWLIRRHEGLDAHEQEALAALLAKDPAFNHAYHWLVRGWDTLDAVKAHPRLAKMREEAIGEASPAPAMPSWRSMAAAAAVLLILGAAAITITSIMRSTEPNRVVTASTQTYQTRRGERLEVRLGDGSVVILNTDTLAKVQLTSVRRLIRLVRGEAYFQVAHDSSRPFVVSAGNRQVVALGTAFDVYVDSRVVKVGLAKGLIIVGPVQGSSHRSNDAPLHVRPGQGVTYDVVHGRTELYSIDLANLLNWREGRLRLDAVTLEEAVAELNRYSDHRIELSDPSLRSIRISGVFQVGRPDIFVAALTKLFPVRAETAGAVTRIEWQNRK